MPYSINHPIGNKHTQPEWMKQVEVGSVLRKGNSFRVVRAVHRYRNGDLRSVTFVIKRCSWTHRCYTSYGYTDLIWNKYELVEGIKVELDSFLDELIKREFNADTRGLSCCDVKDVP